MVTCNFCKKEKAEVRIEYARLNLCKNCFIKFINKKVKESVEKYKMFKPNDIVGVAVSGGKDSTTLIYSLKDLFPKQEIKIIHIDLGIKNYSEYAKEKVKSIAKELGVDLIIYDLKKEENFVIEDFLKTPYRKKICSVCGTIKRYLFNYIAFKNEIDVIATGHTLNDMVRILFSTFLASDFSQMVRIKPVLLSTHPKLKKKVKPLFKVSEKETSLYVKIRKIKFNEKKCPFHIKPKFENLLKNENLAYQLLSSFMKLISLLEDKIQKPKLKECKLCGFPSTNEICSKCKRVSLLKA